MLEANRAKQTARKSTGGRPPKPRLALAAMTRRDSFTGNLNSASTDQSPSEQRGGGDEVDDVGQMLLSSDDSPVLNGKQSMQKNSYSVKQLDDVQMWTAPTSNVRGVDEVEEVPEGLAAAIVLAAANNTEPLASMDIDIPVPKSRTTNGPPKCARCSNMKSNPVCKPIAGSKKCEKCYRDHRNCSWSSENCEPLPSKQKPVFLSDSEDESSLYFQGTSSSVSRHREREASTSSTNDQVGLKCVRCASFANSPICERSDNPKDLKCKKCRRDKQSCSFAPFGRPFGKRKNASTEGEADGKKNERDSPGKETDMSDNTDGTKEDGQDIDGQKEREEEEEEEDKDRGGRKKDEKSNGHKTKYKTGDAEKSSEKAKELEKLNDKTKDKPKKSEEPHAKAKDKTNGQYKEKEKRMEVGPKMKTKEGGKLTVKGSEKLKTKEGERLKTKEVDKSNEEEMGNPKTKDKEKGKEMGEDQVIAKETGVEGESKAAKKRKVTVVDTEDDERITPLKKMKLRFALGPKINSGAKPSTSTNTPEPRPVDQQISNTTSYGSSLRFALGPKINSEAKPPEPWPVDQQNSNTTSFGSSRKSFEDPLASGFRREKASDGNTSEFPGFVRAPRSKGFFTTPRGEQAVPAVANQDTSMEVDSRDRPLAVIERELSAAEYKASSHRAIGESYLRDAEKADQEVARLKEELVAAVRQKASAGLEGAMIERRRLIEILEVQDGT